MCHALGECNRLDCSSSVGIQRFSSKELQGEKRKLWQMWKIETVNFPLKLPGIDYPPYLKRRADWSIDENSFTSYQDDIYYESCFHNIHLFAQKRTCIETLHEILLLTGVIEEGKFQELKISSSSALQIAQVVTLINWALNLFCTCEHSMTHTLYGWKE